MIVIGIWGGIVIGICIVICIGIGICAIEGGGTGDMVMGTFLDGTYIWVIIGTWFICGEIPARTVSDDVCCLDVRGG